MKNYYRQFITLLQEKPGFAMPGRTAAGRIVLEARGEVGRAALYLQDVSPKNSYKLVFVARKDGNNFGAAIGNVVVNERGRFEGRFEFDAKNIGGSGMNCEEIDAAVILVADDGEELVAPLAGFKAAPFSWRVNFSFATAKQATEAAAFEENVPPPAYGFETPEIEVAVPDEGPVHLFTKDTIIQAFSEDNSGTKWVALNLQDVEELGGKWAKLAKSPHISAGFERYRHILLGQNNEDGANSYVIGVPDIFSAENYNSQSVDEYCSFKLCRPDAPPEGAPGYWLRRVD